MNALPRVKTGLKSSERVSRPANFPSGLAAALPLVGAQERLGLPNR